MKYDWVVGTFKTESLEKKQNIPKQCFECVWKNWKMYQLHSQWDVLKIQAEKTKTATSSIFYISD